MHCATAPPLELEDELEDDEELDEELDDELLLDEELDEEELDELELLDELDELDEELEPVALIGTEHSFTPPLIRPPKVASLHMNWPFNDLYRKRPERPNATFVTTGTEQVLFSLQIVILPVGRFAAAAEVLSTAADSPKNNSLLIIKISISIKYINAQVIVFIA